MAGVVNPSPQAQGTVTAFEGARVIVGDGRAPVENATIVVSSGRITQVGPSASVQGVKVER